MSHANYISPLFTPERLKFEATEIAKEINHDKRKLKLDCIAFRGMSGAIMAAIVSVKTNLPIVMVRKETENNHSGMLVEYTDALERMNYCIVDDLIASGKTVRIIDEAIRNDTRNDYIHVELKKIYLYNGGSMSKFRFDAETVIPVYSTDDPDPEW